MSKINFKTYPIKDLTGWINLNDPRTEIDEKQCLKAEGWNFKAWKLTSWEKKKTNSTYSGLINWIYYDYTDIYVISGWSVYKNWTVLYSSWNYTLTFSNINWIPFSIRLDWTSKVYKITTVDEDTAKADLRTALIADFPALTFSAWTWSAITVTKGSSFEITNPYLVKKITIWSWSIEKSFDITIDWVTKTVAPWLYSTYWDIFTYLSTQYWAYYWYNNWDWSFLFSKTDSTDCTYLVTNKTTYSYDYLFYEWDTPNSWQGWLWSEVTIDWTTYKTYWTEWRPFKWSWLIAWLLWSQTTYWNSLATTDPLNTLPAWPLVTMLTSWSITSFTKSGNSTVTRAIIKNSWWTIVATATFSWNTATFATPYSVSAWQQYYFQADSNWATYTRAYTTNPSTVPWANFVYPWYTANITAVTMNVNSPTTWYTKSSSWLHFYIKKTDYSQITWSINNRYSGWFPDDNNFLSITTNTFISTVSIANNTNSLYTTVNNWTLLSSDTLYRIYKSNYWLLFIWYLWTLWAKFVDYATWTWTNITWSHSLWTVYNWKIFLWGKILSTWLTDNIEFSKTYHTDQPSDILVFSWYDAWNQAVSAWNPWYLTWFIIWEDWLYVFKNNEVYKNTKGDEYDWKSKNTITWVEEYVLKYNFKPVTKTWAYSQECITQYWQEIFYYDWINKSIRRLRYEEQQQTLRDTAISHEVDTLLKDIPNPPTNHTQLHSLTFKYPNLEFNYCSTNNFIDNSFWPQTVLPDSQLIFNVETWSWATRPLLTDKGEAPLQPSNWYYININKEVFDFTSTAEYWEFESKVYTLNWVDSYWKRFGWFDIVWDIEPNSWETKTLTIDIYINWVLEETRTLSSTTDLLRFRERIDLYNDWQDIQFKLTHSWKWKIAITDCYLYYKELPFQQSEYY